MVAIAKKGESFAPMVIYLYLYTIGSLALIQSSIGCDNNHGTVPEDILLNILDMSPIITYIIIRSNICSASMSCCRAGPSSNWLFSNMSSAFSAEPSNTTLIFVIILSSLTTAECGKW